MMMIDLNTNKIKLAYGEGYLTLDLGPAVRFDVIEPLDVRGAEDQLQEVIHAINHPLADLRLSSFQNIKTVAIAVNDKTRPVPHALILPPLLNHLMELGIAPENIKCFIATGTHLPMPPAEFEKVLPPEIIHTIQVVSHDCDLSANLKYLGVTSRGTPVWINREYLEADLRIVIGNIEPHHFMGFSGAAKSFSIGLAGRETINKNHAMLTEPNAVMGLFDENPMRQDVEEIARMGALQLALNVTLNTKKEIVKAFCGSPENVIRAGIEEIRKTALVRINQPYDLAIASAGGAPKDINLYQAQKAITHAARCVRDGGAVILAARCPEGSGSAGFEAFIEGLSSMDQVFEKFNRDGFKIGPHKAFQIAKLASRVKIFLISDIPDQQVAKWFITPSPSLEQAFKSASNMIKPMQRIAVLPRATNTVPQIIASDC